MEISNEDLKLIRKFEDISKRGYYCSGQEVTSLHNKILGTRLASTNCSSCIKARIAALVAAADKFERMLELGNKTTEVKEDIKEIEVDDTPQDENKAKEEAPVKPNRKRK